MKIIHYLRQVFFRFILPRHIGKRYAVCRLNIYFSVAFAHSKRHRVFSSRAFHKLLTHILTCYNKYYQRQKRCQKKTERRRHSLFNILGKFNSGIIQPLYKTRVIHYSRLIYIFIILIGKNYLRIRYLNPAYVFFFHHTHESTVVYFFDLITHQQRRYYKIQQYQHQKHDAVIVYHHSFRQKRIYLSAQKSVYIVRDHIQIFGIFIRPVI